MPYSVIKCLIFWGSHPGTIAGPEKEGEGVPDVARELQGDKLEQPKSDTAQQDKALAGLPRPLDGREIARRGRFEQGILFGAAGMAGQAFGPEAIPKGPDHFNIANIVSTRTRAHQRARAVRGSRLRSLHMRTIGPRLVMAKRSGLWQGFHSRLRARYEMVSTRS